MVVTLGMAVYGYTLPFSALDVVRWRPGLIAAALTLGGLIAMSVAPAVRGLRLAREALGLPRLRPGDRRDQGGAAGLQRLVLCGVFAAGVALALALFARRDLPTNS